ncbi:hypothetical protein DAQ1742_00298 [Dickeya aquatica]|uniref:Uncharacterized protein n=1 Tax=Dickeya aquatica TaxID=1401087 RepID=A0A375A5W4_9GAMM|nr:hypothetical protein DAQ1742_00298 [Dickeya aquatica]
MIRRQKIDIYSIQIVSLRAFFCGYLSLFCLPALWFKAGRRVWLAFDACVVTLLPADVG